ncbi:hypothetical protein Anapl_07755 [Anas platyrhynchos]|uniref:Uncharacterized protein n=1 Tax=Anas platyrhynchos TaxID=8839 RepID=R0M0N5_ANAPL|nr:hypothetical protein Anapl_07755 [Anas platyrhynchos]
MLYVHQVSDAYYSFGAFTVRASQDYASCSWHMLLLKITGDAQMGWGYQSKRRRLDPGGVLAAAPVWIWRIAARSPGGRVGSTRRRGGRFGWLRQSRDGQQPAVCGAEPSPTHNGSPKGLWALSTCLSTLLNWGRRLFRAEQVMRHKAKVDKQPSSIVSAGSMCHPSWDPQPCRGEWSYTTVMPRAGTELLLLRIVVGSPKLQADFSWVLARSECLRLQTRVHKAQLKPHSTEAQHICHQYIQGTRQLDSSPRCHHAGAPSYTMLAAPELQQKVAVMSKGCFSVLLRYHTASHTCSRLTRTETKGCFLTPQQLSLKKRNYQMFLCNSCMSKIVDKPTASLYYKHRKHTASKKHVSHLLEVGKQLHSMVFVKEMPLTAVGSGVQGYIPVGLRWPDEAPHLTSPHTAVRAFKIQDIAEQQITQVLCEGIWDLPTYQYVVPSHCFGSLDLSTRIIISLTEQMLFLGSLLCSGTLRAIPIAVAISAGSEKTYVLANLHCRDSEKGAISNAVALDFLLRLFLKVSAETLCVPPSSMFSATCTPIYTMSLIFPLLKCHKTTLLPFPIHSVRRQLTQSFGIYWLLLNGCHHSQSIGSRIRASGSGVCTGFLQKCAQSGVGKLACDRPRAQQSTDLRMPFVQCVFLHPTLPVRTGRCFLRPRHILLWLLKTRQKLLQQGCEDESDVLVTPQPSTELDPPGGMCRRILLSQHLGDQLASTYWVLHALIRPSLMKLKGRTRPPNYIGSSELQRGGFLKMEEAVEKDPNVKNREIRIFRLSRETECTPCNTHKRSYRRKFSGEIPALTLLLPDIEDDALLAFVNNTKSRYI